MKFLGTNTHAVDRTLRVQVTEFRNSAFGTYICLVRIGVITDSLHRDYKTRLFRPEFDLLTDTTKINKTGRMTLTEINKSIGVKSSVQDFKNYFLNM